MHDPMRTRIGPGSVALTFDDGPDRRWTPAVLDELDRLDVRATFFLIVGTEPRLVERIAGAGHEIGYHCGRHVRHSSREREVVRHETIEDLLWLERRGCSPRIWRTPWGDSAPWTSLLASELGLELWRWSDDTHDWAGPDAQTMLADLSRTLTGGSVVLMHDGIGPGALRDDPRETVALIEPLVELSRERGLEPRTISSVTPRTPAVA